MLNMLSHTPQKSSVQQMHAQGFTVQPKLLYYGVGGLYSRVYKMANACGEEIFVLGNGETLGSAEWQALK